jgi:hypothetical protein
LRITPENSGAAIVMIGSFNPVIFQPEWFARTGIIEAGQIASASVEIVHPDMTAFSLDWLKLRVVKERFAVETASPPFIRVRDLVLRIFGEFLVHTPINQMGVNMIVHFSVGTPDMRNKIGNLLAPKDPWGDWKKDIEGEPGKLETIGGLISLTMMQARRTDGHAGVITAKVEPSLLPHLGQHGIFMEVNDHYNLGDPRSLAGSDAAIAVLESEWERSIQRSEHIIDQIMALRD